MFLEDIKILLIKKGLSQAELARKLDDSPQNFGQKLSKNNIKENDLKQICDVLGVKAEIIYKDKESEEVIYRNEI